MTVYHPREDSFLLKDYLEELELEDKRVLDMGTGSGIIGIEAAKQGAEVIAADINPEAIEAAGNNAGDVSSIEFVESDLFENIDGKFDFLLFNPPYLPGKEGVGDEEIWRGGENGIEVTQKFLQDAPDYLKERGKILVVMSSHADWEPVLERFDLEVVDSEKLWFETLYLARSK